MNGLQVWTSYMILHLVWFLHNSFEFIFPDIFFSQLQDRVWSALIISTHIYIYILYSPIFKLNLDQMYWCGVSVLHLIFRQSLSKKLIHETVHWTFYWKLNNYNYLCTVSMGIMIRACLYLFTNKTWMLSMINAILLREINWGQGKSQGIVL